MSTLVTGCGPTGPGTYELDQKNVEVDDGEEFTLSVPVETAMGEWWYLTTPRPDAAVVEYLGKDEVIEGDDADEAGGGSGTDSFGFKAAGAGTTKIRLIQCPAAPARAAAARAGPSHPRPSRAAVRRPARGTGRPSTPTP